MPFVPENLTLPMSVSPEPPARCTEPAAFDVEIGFVMMLITPPNAPAPYRVAPGPRTISMRSMSWRS